MLNQTAEEIANAVYPTYQKVRNIGSAAEATAVEATCIAVADVLQFRAEITPDERIEFFRAAGMDEIAEAIKQRKVR